MKKFLDLATSFIISTLIVLWILLTICIISFVVVILSPFILFFWFINFIIDKFKKDDIYD